MTINKHKGQRVAVFIDTQNLYHTAKNLYHARVNFGHILKDVVGERELVRAFAYLVTTETGEEKAFLEALTKMGIELKLKDLQVFSSGAKKADWDVGLAVDAIKIAFAYLVTTETGEEKAFLEALTKMGIELKLKDLQVFSSGAKKADWDVGLAVDAIKIAPKVDAIVIVSGDGDFIPLVEYLQALGVQVEVASFAKSSSGKLKEAVDDFIDLSENIRKYLIRNGNGPNRPRSPRPVKK